MFQIAVLKSITALSAPSILMEIRSVLNVSLQPLNSQKIDSPVPPFPILTALVISPTVMAATPPPTNATLAQLLGSYPPKPILHPVFFLTVTPLSKVAINAILLETKSSALFALVIEKLLLTTELVRSLLVRINSLTVSNV